MTEKETNQTKVSVEENKMGIMPEGKLLLSISVPMMLSMLVQALYNIVDSIFISRISEDALTAVSLAYPLQSVMIGLSVGTGVGVNALLSKKLGENDHKSASEIAKNGIFLSLIGAFIFLVLSLFVVRPYYLFQTDDAEIIHHGTQYLSIVCGCSVGLFGQFIFERLLQSTGKTFYTMITQMAGAIINMILDPILIFGLFGFPRMEAAGAALATVIGQVSAAVMAYIYNLKKNKEINIDFKRFRPSGILAVQIYKIGIPTMLVQSMGSIMMFCMNMILIAFSSTATAVFGVYFKLQSFIFMPVFGLTNGMIPIIAFNYGARKKSRMMRTYQLSLLYSIVIMFIGTIIFEVIPDKLFLLFDASEQMLELGIPALRIISIHFVMGAFSIVTGSVFQALGKSVYSMLASVCRQLVVLIPAAYLLSMLGKVDYVWWAFPIAELFALVVSVLFIFKMKRDIIDKL